MSRLRQDPITGRWTVFAPGRVQRPDEYPKRPPPSSAANCPFCEGHESWTPPEVAAIRPGGRAANGPGWSVRAIPNKFPSLTPDSREEEVARDPEGFAQQPGRGFHEVIIETPDHTSRLANLSSVQVRRFLRVLRDRARALAAMPEIASLVVFENSGPESGGTLFHPHAQIVAVPEIVPRLSEELAGLSRFPHAAEGGCPFETVTARERSARTRIVREAEGFTAYCPFASEFPYEVRIMPHGHHGSFGGATDPEIDVLGELLPDLLRRYEEIAPEASYNFVVRSVSDARPEQATYHWHLDLLPRLIRPDGFDLGGGIFVNPFTPEVAAQELRSAASRPAPAERPPKD